jgi:hypothetical protein
MKFRAQFVGLFLCAGCAAQIPPAPDKGHTPAPSGMQPVPSSPAPAAPDAAPVVPPIGNPVVPARDAAPPADAPPAAPGGDGETYSCTLIFGINATAEWYDQGFEKLVDNAKWELVRVHSGFIELWANPSDAVWKTAISSPCAQDPTKPDRILFVALNFDFTTLDQWLPPLTATVKNLRAKYPSARRIELATFVRAPGNKACAQGPAKRSTIAPAEDQAIDMVVATDPSVLRVAPKFEAKTCAEFSGNPPHPTAAGGMAWAKQFADHYGP